MTQQRGSAMERQLQQQQHEQNQARFEKLESSHQQLLDSQSKQNVVLARIEENTKGIPDLTKRVDELEEGRGKIKGAIAGLGIVSPILGGLAAKVFKL